MRTAVTTDATASRSGTRLLPRRAVGCFFLWTSGIHIGLVAADADVYRHFADHPVLSQFGRAWREVFMAHPSVWGLGLATGELLLGLLLLASSRLAGWGWAGVITFHVALLGFGWGLWIWAVPALMLLVPSALVDVRRSRGGALITRR